MIWNSCALFLALLVAHGHTGNVIELHAHDSEQLFENSWLVMFYAPWCPACQELKPQWEKFADKERTDALKIAQIDVNKYPALSGQFLIFNLPSIYYIHNGECKQYLGLHDMSYITTWVDNGGWKTAEPIPSWRAPNGVLSRSIGKFFNFANHIRNLKNTLVEDYGMPSWFAYVIFVIGTILLGLLAGLTLVCLCDCIFPPPREAEVAVTEGRSEGETDEEREEEDEGETEEDKAEEDKAEEDKAEEDKVEDDKEKKKAKKTKTDAGDAKGAKKAGDGKLRKRKK